MRWMNCGCAIAALMAAMWTAPVMGQTAGMQSFQGLIKDAKGDPVSGPVDLEFRIYDAEVAGNLVDMDGDGVVEDSCGQDATCVVAVSVTNGILSTKFGPISPAAFDGNPRWLEVRVDTEPLSRIEMATAPATSEQVYYSGTGNPAIEVENDLINIGGGVITAFIPTASVGIATDSPGYPGHDSVVLELFGSPRPIFPIHRPANASQPEAEFLIAMEELESTEFEPTSCRSFSQFAWPVVSARCPGRPIGRTSV